MFIFYLGSQTFIKSLSLSTEHTQRGNAFFGLGAAFVFSKAYKQTQQKIKRSTQNIQDTFASPVPHESVFYENFIY